MSNNFLVLVVLLVLAWASYDAGLTFFAFLMVIGAVLLIVTQKQDRQSSGPYYSSGEPGQPIIVEQPASSGKGEIKMKVKKWKDRWDGHPQEYAFLHFGIALSNIFRSILYLFGIQKDE